MATILEYAHMANAAYEADFALPPELKGWQLIDSKPSGSGIGEAFQGAAWQRGNEVVAAFKGTAFGGETFKRDAAADVKLFFGMNTTQYADAMDFVAQLPAHPGCRVTVCGHSLGGAIAQVVGNRARVLFCTFNAPGVALVSRNIGEVTSSPMQGTRLGGAAFSAMLHPVQAAQDVAAAFHVTRGANFRVGRDIVGTMGVHYGRVIELPYLGGALDLKRKHLMTTMLATLVGPPRSPWVGRELVDVAG